MLETALKAAGEFVEVVDVTTVKPLDYKYLNGVGSAKILTLEENVKSGGFGESVAAYLASCNRPNVVKVLAVEDEFVSHATIDEQISMCGMDTENVARILSEMLANC